MKAIDRIAAVLSSKSSDAPAQAAPDNDSKDDKDIQVDVVEVIPDDIPSLVIIFHSPNEPEFKFLNWNSPPSMGALERMTGRLFRAAQAELSRVRREAENQKLMTERSGDSKQT